MGTAFDRSFLLVEGRKDRIKGCLMIIVPDVDPAGAFGRLAGFRAEFHRCLSARSDVLFEQEQPAAGGKADPALEPARTVEDLRTGSASGPGQ
jgi:hypothetical protein